MDPQTASYYRAILFLDGQETRKLPPTLLLMHAWAAKRCHAMGLGSTIAKQTALAVAMTWMSTTKEGREFTRESTTLGEIFSNPDDEPVTDGSSDKEVDWKSVDPDTPVFVSINGALTPGLYVGRRSSWVDVLVGGEKKQFRTHQVQLAGA
jgi:hypothetical protein